MAFRRSITTPGDETRVEQVSSRHALEEFARLPYQVYAGRAAWWPPDVQNEIDFLTRRTPVAAYLDVAGFCARRADGGASERGDKPPLQRSLERTAWTPDPFRGAGRREPSDRSHASRGDGVAACPRDGGGAERVCRLSRLSLRNRQLRSPPAIPAAGQSCLLPLLSQGGWLRGREGPGRLHRCAGWRDAVALSEHCRR